MSERFIGVASQFREENDLPLPDYFLAETAEGMATEEGEGEGVEGEEGAEGEGEEEAP